MVACQIPNDTLWSEVVFAAQMKNLLGNLRRCLVGWIFRNCFGIDQPSFTVALMGALPSVKAGPDKPKIAATLATCPIFSACCNIRNLRCNSRSSSLVIDTSPSCFRNLQKMSHESFHIYIKLIADGMMILLVKDQRKTISARLDASDVITR